MEPKKTPAPVSPDCRDGNHTKCDGQAWSERLDRIVTCACLKRGCPCSVLVY